MSIISNSEVIYTTSRSFAAGCQGTGTDPAGAREEARRKLETMGKPLENHGKTMGKP